MTAYANVDGHTLVDASIHVPNRGTWWAKVVFELAPDVSGSVVLNIGNVALNGTVAVGQVFGEQLVATIVGGGGGWGTLLAAQHYHSDGVTGGGGGVAARTVADDAARLAGETIGTFVVTKTHVGIDYVRESGPASRVLDDATSLTQWHVDYNGNTNVGERATVEADATAYQVLDVDAYRQLATLAVDDLASVRVGSIISSGLAQPETIREMQIIVTPDTSRAIAWFGGDSTSRGRLAGAIDGIVRRVTSDKLHGLFQYRVTAMSGNRCNLQIVNQDGRLPDAIPLSMQPGVAGAHSKLTPGTIVLVQFVDGLRSHPVVTAFAGKDSQGHETQELDFSVAVALRLGGPTATEGVTLGDSHKTWADGHKHAAGDFTTPIGGGGGGGPVTGTSGPPTSAAPSPSTKVKVLP